MWEGGENSARHPSTKTVVMKNRQMYRVQMYLFASRGLIIKTKQHEHQSWKMLSSVLRIRILLYLYPSSAALWIQIHTIKNRRED